MIIREVDSGRGAEVISQLETRKDKWDAVRELNNADLLDAFEVGLTWPSPNWEILNLLRSALQSRLDFDCEVCGVNMLEWEDHISNDPGCPQCGLPVHAADGDWGCEGYYATPRTCDYHGSADDQLKQFEGADSPQGIRYHEGQEIDDGGDFD